MGLWNILIIVGNWYLTVSFFLPHLNSLGVFLFVKAVEEERKERERERERERSFSFQLYIICCFFYTATLLRGMSSWIIWEPSFLPNQALKYISRLRLLISPNSVWSCLVVFSCCLLQHSSLLAADTNCIWSKKNSAKQACFLSSSRAEENPFILKDPAEVRANFSLSKGQFLFSCMRCPTSSWGLLGVSAFFKNIFCCRKNYVFLFGALINLTVWVDTYFHPIRTTHPIHFSGQHQIGWGKATKHSLPQNFFELDRRLLF